MLTGATVAITVIKVKDFIVPFERFRTIWQILGCNCFQICIHSSRLRAQVIVSILQFLVWRTLLGLNDISMPVHSELNY